MVVMLNEVYLTLYPDNSHQNVSVLSPWQQINVDKIKILPFKQIFCITIKFLESFGNMHKI